MVKSYGIRCLSTGEVWVGDFQNTDKLLIELQKLGTVLNCGQNRYSIKKDDTIVFSGEVVPIYETKPFSEFSLSIEEVPVGVGHSTIPYGFGV